MKQEAAARREEVERLELEAEANRNQPVDDSKIVEQMFGFLPEGEQAQTADDSMFVRAYVYNCVVCVCVCVQCRCI